MATMLGYTSVCSTRSAVATLVLDCRRIKYRSVVGERCPCCAIADMGVLTGTGSRSGTCNPWGRGWCNSSKDLVGMGQCVCTSYPEKAQREHPPETT